MGQQQEPRIFHGIARIGLIVLLTILYTVVLPLHYHDDLVEHGDCILCQLSYIASTIVTVCISLAAFGAVVLVFQQTGPSCIKTITSFSLSRAPPVV